MKGIIWYYSHKEMAIEKLKEIIKGYHKLDIHTTNFPNNKFYCINFSNGDIWQIVSANDRARGMCCNVSYIARDIPEDIIEYIIKPCTKAFPYRAFQYYGEIEYDNDVFMQSEFDGV